MEPFDNRPDTFGQDQSEEEKQENLDNLRRHDPQEAQANHQCCGEPKGSRRNEDETRLVRGPIRGWCTMRR